MSRCAGLGCRLTGGGADMNPYRYEDIMRLQPARLGGILLAVVTTLLASVPMAVAAGAAALRERELCEL